jgi:aldehyde oxidoreductase
VPGMLHGAMVLSEHPRARVLAIHTDAAAQSTGVVRIFTARDVPGERGTGLAVPDLPMFVAVDEVTCCVGDFIAMVVADTQFHARKAAAKIKVDFEVLEPITDPFKALEPDAPRVHSDDTYRPAPNVIEVPTKFGRGNVDAAFAGAAHVIEATFKTQAVDIAFLEPESCLAYPLEIADPKGSRRGGIKVHSESQGSQFDQKTISKALNLAESDVEIALAASGGAFGAKEELSIQAQTAMAAYLLGRPVKTTLTREQSTQHHVKRHPMTITL